MTEYVMHMVLSSNQRQSVYIDSKEALEEVVRQLEAIIDKGNTIDKTRNFEELIGRGPETVAVFSNESRLVGTKLFLKHYRKFFNFYEEGAVIDA